MKKIIAAFAAFLAVFGAGSETLGEKVLDRSSFVPGRPDYIIYSAPEVFVSASGDAINLASNSGNEHYLVIEPHGTSYWLYAMDNTGSGDMTVYEFSSADAALDFITLVYSLKYAVMEKIWRYYGGGDELYADGNGLLKKTDASIRTALKSRMTYKPDENKIIFDKILDVVSYTYCEEFKETPGRIVMDAYENALKKKASSVRNEELIHVYGSELHHLRSFAMVTRFTPVAAGTYDRRIFRAYIVNQTAIDALMKQPVVICTRNLKLCRTYRDFMIWESGKSGLLALCPDGIDKMIQDDHDFTGNGTLFSKNESAEYIKENYIEIWRR